MTQQMRDLENRKLGREEGIEIGKKAGIIEGKKAGIIEGKKAGIIEGKKAGIQETIRVISEVKDKLLSEDEAAKRLEISVEELRQMLD